VTLRALLAERGNKVSYYAVWHFVEHEGISFKKSLYVGEQDRPDLTRRRTQWKKCQGRAARVCTAGLRLRYQRDRPPAVLAGRARLQISQTVKVVKE
jgi:hypothetical protein